MGLISSKCTQLVQPVDVGIGKSFKDGCHKLWWDWMVQEDPTGRATHEQQCKWIKEAWATMMPEIICNCQRKIGLSFFPNH